MNFDEYSHGGRALYEELAETVARILKAAIDKAAPHLRVQEIQRRAKDPDSLKKKLAKLENASSDVAEAVKDLAGCRVLFYSNLDFGQFQQSGIISDNFEIDWPRTRFHFPETEESTEQFRSLNFVVTLSAARAELPEYAHLKDLRCEIQVQTALNHTWSEMGHDTIYKRLELTPGFGTDAMKGIEARMKEILLQYLVPAGHAFDRVIREFEQLASGKALLDSKPLELLASCTDNYARGELLSRLQETVLPFYDDVMAVQHEIRAARVAVIKAARLGSDDLDKADHMPSGYHVERVTRLALEILDSLRYLGEEGTQATWAALVDLYDEASTDPQRTLVLDSVHRLAANNLDVWVETDAPIVQGIVMEQLTALDETALSRLRPLVLKALRSMLNPIAETIRRRGVGAEISRAHIPHSEELEVLRGKAVQLMRRLLVATKTDEERREVIKHMAPASALSHLGASEGGQKLILQEMAAIFGIYTEFGSLLSLGLRQQLEYDALIEHRHLTERSAGDAAAGRDEARAQLAAALLRFKQTLNADTLFVRYKALLGYNSVFEPAWTDPDFEIDAIDDYREQERKKYIGQINEATAADWHATLVSCVSEKSSPGDYPPFCEFLEQLGAAKPGIALAFARDADPALEFFLPNLLKGIELGGLREPLADLIDGWMDAGLHLGAIARYLEKAEPVDIDLLGRMVRRAMQQKDQTSLALAMSALTSPREEAQAQRWALFLEAIQSLAEDGDTRWVSLVSGRAKRPGIFKGRSAADVALVLNALRPLPRLDFGSEQVISAMAADWPRLVLDFFANRIRYARTAERGYDAVPHQFPFLKDVLQGEIDHLIEVMKTLYREDPRLFYFRSGTLVSNIFPDFSPALNDAFMKFVSAGDEEDLMLVATLLQAYRGDPRIHDLCKAIIDKATTQTVLTAVDIAVVATPVVHGPHGFAEAHAGHRERLQGWLDDPREPVREFAKKLSHRLSLQIAEERRRAEVRVEQNRDE